MRARSGTTSDAFWFHSHKTRRFARSSENSWAVGPRLRSMHSIDCAVPEWFLGRRPGRCGLVVIYTRFILHNTCCETSIGGLQNRKLLCRWWNTAARRAFVHRAGCRRAALPPVEERRSLLRTHCTSDGQVFLNGPDGSPTPGRRAH